jgi:hypothetical protein
MLHKNLTEILKFSVSAINVKIFKVSVFGLAMHYGKKKH